MASTKARSLLTRGAILVALSAGVVACSGVDDGVDDSEGVGEDGDDSFESTEEAFTVAGPCSGRTIDRAVQCARAKGARVISYYRSPADQERVRRENHCANRCSGQSGCVRPTAGCTTSPHTACHAVDLMADGAPLSRASLRACGLAKTTAPHRNHFDLVN